MRIICKNPPHGVIFSGEYYPVRTEHTVWREFAQLLERGGDDAAALSALKLCYRDKIPYDYTEALKLLCEFFSGGKLGETTDRAEPIMSFTEDEDLIFASFYSEYGIDLAQKELHWWQFLALLRGLSSDTALMRVIKIRTTRISDIKNPEQRQRLIRLKRTFALKNQADADVAAALGAAFGDKEGEDG